MTDLPTSHSSLIEVRADHFGLVLAGAVRYALGRRTSAVGDTIDMVHAYWPALPNNWRDVIERDVKEEHLRAQDADYLIGDQCDHDAWEALIDWFEDQVEYERTGR